MNGLGDPAVAFALGLAVMLWLPGHLILRLPQATGIAPTDRVAAGHSPPASDRLFVAVSISALLLLWFAVTLATLGVLWRSTLLGAAALPALAAIGGLRRTGGASARAASRPRAVPGQDVARRPLPPARRFASMGGPPSPWRIP